MRQWLLALMAAAVFIYSSGVRAEESVPQPPALYLVPHGAGAGMEYPLAVKNWWGQVEYRYLDSRADPAAQDSFNDPSQRDNGSHLLRLGLTYHFPLR